MVAVCSLIVNVGVSCMGGGGLLVVSAVTITVTIAVEEPTTVSCAGSARRYRSRSCVVIIAILTEDSVTGGSRVAGSGGIHETSIICTAMVDTVMTNSTTMPKTVVVTNVVIGGGHGYVVAGAVRMSRSISSTTAGEIGKETHG